MMKKVLVAEDEAIVALSLQFNLEKAGYEVCVASTGEEALAELGKGGYHAAILDYSLEGMNGKEVARRARDMESYDGTRFAVMSGLPEDSLQREVEGAGVRYFSKPFEMKKIMEFLGE